MSFARRGAARDERGIVTAELAMALPLLVAMTVGLVWLLTLAGAQVRVIDAARESARASARGDDPAAAIAVGERVVPAGGSVSVTSSGGEVRAEAQVTISGPGGLFGFLPGVTLHAEAVALAEQSPVPVPVPVRVTVP